MRTRSSLIFALAFVLGLFGRQQNALAEDGFHPSRLRLILHGSKKLNDRITLTARLIPSPTLRGTLTPLVFGGVKVRLGPSFTLAPQAGWSFIKNEPFLSLGLAFAARPLVLGLQVDYRFPSQQGYVFATAEVPVTDWLMVGVETENWGSLLSPAWSCGGGPNLLFQLKQAKSLGVGLDVAAHIRSLEGQTQPEIFLRFHVFLP